MLDEIKKSASSIFEERMTSPFFGSFIFSWLIWNWQIPYLTIFVGQEYIKPVTKLDYILKHNSSILNLLVYPFLSAILLITLVPFLTNWLFKVYLHFEKERIKSKEDLNLGRRITIEEAAQIRNDTLEQATKNQQQITAKNNEVSVLKEQVEIFNQEKVKFKVLFARYGEKNSYIEVTQKVNALLVGQSKFLVSNDDLGSDPLFNIHKSLLIVYSWQNEIYSITAKENYQIEIDPNNGLLILKETEKSRIAYPNTLYEEFGNKISSIEVFFPGTWELSYSGTITGNEEVEIKDKNKYFAKPENANYFIHYFDIENIMIDLEHNKLLFTKVGIEPNARRIESILDILEIGKQYQGTEDNGSIKVIYTKV